MNPALLAETAAPSGRAGPDLLRYLLVCAFLILLIVALGALLRRLARGALRGRAARRALATVDVLPLGGKQRVAVVRCYDRSYLLGLGDKEVRLLAALDDEGQDAPETTVLQPAPAARAGSFLGALRRVASRPPAAPRPAEGARLEPAGAQARRKTLRPDGARRRRIEAAEAPRLPGGGLLG